MLMKKFQKHLIKWEIERFSDNRLHHVLYRYKRIFVVYIWQPLMTKTFELKLVDLTPNDDAPLRSEKELLNLICFSVLWLISLSFPPTKFFVIKGYFAEFKVKALLELLSTLSQRDRREARFVESIIECTKLNTEIIFEDMHQSFDGIDEGTILILP